MVFKTMVDVTSKTFWLGVFMVVAGLGKYAGVPFVIDIVNNIYPNMDAGMLVSAGLAAIFVKDAIAKTGPTT